MAGLAPLVGRRRLGELPTGFESYHESSRNLWAGQFFALIGGIGVNRLPDTFSQCSNTRPPAGNRSDARKGVWVRRAGAGWTETRTTGRHYWRGGGRAAKRRFANGLSSREGRNTFCRCDSKAERSLIKSSYSASASLVRNKEFHRAGRRLYVRLGLSFRTEAPEHNPRSRFGQRHRAVLGRCGSYERCGRVCKDRQTLSNLNRVAEEKVVADDGDGENPVRLGFSLSESSAPSVAYLNAHAAMAFLKPLTCLWAR
jgi:hypothetical protein